MRYLILINIFFIALFYNTSSLFAQAEEKPYQAYYFEGDEVVFEFDPKQHNKLTHKNKSQRLDFEDIDIYKVALSGNFNNWSMKGWKMKRTRDGKFQIRKKIEDFDDQFKWEFKFIVNGKYWAEPGKNISNKSEVTFHNDLWEDVYNLDLYTIAPVPIGNAHFFLPGYPDAEKVYLSGSFNAWATEDFLMKPTTNGWELYLELPLGKYEYKFIVDGKWTHDPNNPDIVMNSHHTLNSILEIKKDVNFWLKGYPDAKRVYLAGSFNNWKPEEIAMHKEGNTWVVNLNLSGGKHWYKFIVDGEWITDPKNPIRENDRGHINSVIMVQ